MKKIVLSVLVVTLLPVSRAWSAPEGRHQLRGERQVNRVRIRSSPCVFVSTSSRRGMLGVSLMDLTPELRDHYGAPADVGVMVAKVEEDGPAVKAGVRVGDILTGVDGEEVSTSREVARLIRRKEEGDIVELEIYRDGGRQILNATIAEAERSQVDLGGYFSEPCDDLEFDIDIDTEAIQEAVEEATRHFRSPEWRERWSRIDELDEEKMEDKLKEMEERLEELEKQLEIELEKKSKPKNI